MVKDEQGYPHVYLSRRAINYYGEEKLRNRGVGDFLVGKKQSSSFKCIRSKEKANTFWLPSQCVAPEIEEAKFKKNADGDYRFIWPKGEVPSTDALSQQQFLDLLEKLLGNGPDYFYGYEGAVPNGPEPKNHYLKLGMTSKGLKGVGTRFRQRYTYDSWYPDSKVRGRWAVPLKPLNQEITNIVFSASGERVKSTGKAAEILFRLAFGTSLIRWKDTGHVYLGEYYQPWNPNIQEIAGILEARFRHPRNEWKTKNRTKGQII